MRFVAFLRNVNLGQPKSPSRAQLENAFQQAGTDNAASFLSNGTLVYTAPGRRAAEQMAKQARETLRAQCGMSEPIFVHGLADLADLAAGDPFAAFRRTDYTERAISFFERRAGAKLRAPLESERGDCLVFRIEAGLALSLMRTIGGKTGYPTPVLEKALGAPVTTRSWRTIERLLDRHG